MTPWLVLAATLPTSPSGLRVRVWRSLKATGAGTLREGVHVLPGHAGTTDTLRSLATVITEAGADAHLLEVSSRDEAQEAAFRALFDRAESYAELLRLVKEAHGSIGKVTEAALRKTLHGLDHHLASIQRVDFFPAPAGQKAAAALGALRREVERHLSPGEPTPAPLAIEARAIADYQGRTWATRRRPWVDRLATAWLVQRFIDRQPTFTWLAEPKRCPESCLGYDFDGATFTHVGEKVTFEVVAESFGLLEDPALQRFAALVHYIDAGGVPVDEAPGFEALVRGLQARHPRDAELLAAAIPLFDAFYLAMREPHDR